jgi:hypothetical protein
MKSKAGLVAGPPALGLIRVPPPGFTLHFIAT